MATSTRNTESRVDSGNYTTRYDPAGTSRRAKVVAGDGLKQSDESVRCAPAASHDEAGLFAGGPSPRLFGEGSYTMGGSPAEGNYALPDSNPRGGYGSFSDAGGFGSPQLLGEEESVCRQSSSEGEDPSCAAAATAEQTNDTRHSSGVPASADLVKGQCFKHD